jgi:hypothetical protein
VAGQGNQDEGTGGDAGVAGDSGVQGATEGLTCVAQAEGPGNLTYSPELLERMVELGFCWGRFLGS